MSQISYDICFFFKFQLTNTYKYTTCPFLFMKSENTDLEQTSKNLQASLQKLTIIRQVTTFLKICRAKQLATIKQVKLKFNKFAVQNQVDNFWTYAHLGAK